nr:ribonuclease H-like domain-containing protein [Tanacetum cinerariifolium]
MTGDDNRDGEQPETSNPTPLIPPPTQQIPHTVSFIKLPILKQREYDIWAMKIKHYLSHTDCPIWQVIQNGNGPVSVITDANGMIKVLPSKTAEEVVARERERQARTTLLMALPEDHLAKFHKIADAKEMWEAIKSRFEGLHKGYDRFQTLLSQLEIHGVGFSHEDANQKFLRVFERDVKGTTTSSSSNTHNVAFVSADNTSSTNDVSIAYSVSCPSVSKSQKEGSASYTYEVIHSFFANQSSAPQLDCDDLEAKGNQDNRRRDGGYNGNKARDNGRRHAYQDDSKALVTIDEEAVDWSGHVEEDNQNFAMMAYSSSNSGSDNESVFMNKEYDLENTHVNDRYAEGMHTVPPPMTGNYMPSGPIVEIDYSKFTYGPKQTSTNESDFKPVEYAFSDSESSVETTTSMSAPVDNASKIDDLHKALKGKLIIDSRCFRLDFEDVYYVEELKHYNLFCVSQMCDKKNKVLFTNTDSLVQSPDFKLPDENQDETTPILKDFIRQAGNQVNHKVKTIRSDNGTEFKNHDLIELCGLKGIKREYSNARTPQHNGVAERKNRTLIEAAKTMLADLFLPSTFWAEAVNTACYVLNREELQKLKGQEKEADDAVWKEDTHETQDVNTNSTNLLNVVSIPVSVVGPSRALNDNEPSYPDDPSMPHLEEIYASPSAGIFTDSSYDNEGVVTDFNNLETTVTVSLTPTTIIHTIHPKTQILRDPLSAVQTRSKVHKNFEAYDLVWILLYLSFRKKTYGTKWVYRNKKDKRGVVVRNKACLVLQGHRQQERINYDEVFAHVARIEAIRIFLAFASYMGFIVYQMDVKSAFLYGTIDEEVYVTQPPGFVDPKFPNKVYKVVKDLYGLHQAPKGCVKTTSTPTETQKPLVKDEEAADVDSMLVLDFRLPPRLHTFKLGRGSLDGDYVGANLDRKSTTGATLLKGRLLEVTTAKHSNEALAIPEQTAAAKETLNSLMADSLRITILLTILAVKLLLFMGYA